MHTIVQLILVLLEEKHLMIAMVIQNIEPVGLIVSYKHLLQI